MYLAALYQILRRRGVTLLDYYTQILDATGEYDCVGRSVMMSGAMGMQRKEQIMRTLRQSYPRTLAGAAVRKVVDHWDEKAFGPFVSETQKLPRDVLQFFTDAGVVTIRPSGTEPKIKVYYQLVPSAEPTRAKGEALLKAVRGRADDFTCAVYNELLAIIGLHLSVPALKLPDIVDLDCRVAFEQATLPALREGLRRGRFRSLDKDLLPWLRDETKNMTPGADPLPALKAAVASACGEWEPELRDARGFSELAAWAAGAATAKGP